MIMMALSLTVVLVAVAMVLDFGLVRVHQQINRSAADSATMAGVQALNPGDGTAHPWLGVCTALAYLQANDPTLSSLAGHYQTGAGSGLSSMCTSGSVSTASCMPNQKPTWAWYWGTTPDGKIRVDIKSGYATPDPAFSEDATMVADHSDAALGGCDQLAVIIQQTDKPGLGSLATSSDLVTRVRSVARVGLGSFNSGPTALLLLERHNCLALSTGSTNTYIDIMGFGAAPGSIHADSLGDATGNGSLCNSGNKVIYGKFSQRIKAHKAETGQAPGIITVSALTGLPGAVPGNATDGAANVCVEQSNGSCAIAGAQGYVGRGPVDARYLSGVRSAMSTATAATAWTTGNATSNGFTIYTPSPNCGQLSGTPPAAIDAASKVFVNCPSGATFKNFTFTNATSVVFNGTVSISSGQTLAIPNAQRVYVKGATGGSGLSANGNLALNTGTSALASNAGSSALCPARASAPRDQLVVSNGGLSGGAQSTFHLCNTTILMADGWNSTCPLPATVTPITVEPTDNSCYGYLGLGGQGTMEWSAPNLVASGATATDWNQLEDLAVWTETAGTVSSSASNNVGGGGTMLISGVFFLPNANPFTLTGGGLQSNGANAQFITRRLTASGQGTLFMRPNPDDVVSIPLAPTYELVR
jgi:hypothetical protein